MDRSDDWQHGHVTTVNPARGFVFLDNNVFVHRTSMPAGQFDGLREGDAIEFRPVQPEPPKGPRAGKARRATDGA